jgi:hypothetical protein
LIIAMLSLGLAIPCAAGEGLAISAELYAQLTGLAVHEEAPGGGWQLQGIMKAKAGVPTGGSVWPKQSETAPGSYLVELNLSAIKDADRLTQVARSLGGLLPPVRLRVTKGQGFDTILRQLGLAGDAKLREVVTYHLKLQVGAGFYGNAVLRDRELQLPAAPLQTIDRRSDTTLVWRAFGAPESSERRLSLGALFGELSDGVGKLRIYNLTRREVLALQTDTAIDSVMTVLGGAVSTEDVLSEPVPPAEPAEPSPYGWIAATLPPQPTRESYVVVFDSGWPTEPERIRAITEFQRICSQVRRTAGLDGYAVWQQLPKSGPTGGLPVRPHSAQIDSSLTELRQADGGRFVRVLYLPFWKTQESAALLTEIALLGAVLENRLVLARLSAQGRTDKVNEALQRMLTDTLASVDQTAQLFDARRPDALVTDRAIIRGLITVMQAYAANSGARYTLSCSWIVPDRDLSVSLPAQDRGLLVAAAGNLPLRDFMDFDLAQRVALSGDTVTVLNITGGQLHPTSSSTRNQSAMERKLVGFDGKIPTLRDPASSFSTPRVAWFISLGEALRRRDYPNILWLDKVQQWLLAARSPRGQPTEFLLDPQKYLTAARQEPP